MGYGDEQRNAKLQRHDQMQRVLTRQLHHTDHLDRARRGPQQRSSGRAGSRSEKRPELHAGASLQAFRRAMNDSPPRPSRKGPFNQRGLTLIEMAIAMTVAMFLLAGITTVVMGIRTSF